MKHLKWLSAGLTIWGILALGMFMLGDMFMANGPQDLHIVTKLVGGGLLLVMSYGMGKELVG